MTTEVLALPQIDKPDGIKCLGPVDITELAARVRAIPENVWAEENARKENAMAVFAHTTHIILRFIPGNHDALVHYSKTLWPDWEDLLVPLMIETVRSYGFESPVFAKVMFARLAAGGEIGWHVDGAGSNLTTHKIHIPVITSPAAVLRDMQREYHLEAGQAYELNNLIRHSGSNHGSEDRTHLIFEVYDAARIMRAEPLSARA